VSMRALVVTVVHHPLDARIWSREVAALLDAGHHVTYVAPWSATSTTPPDAVDAVDALDVPRAVGRRRLGALREARRVLRSVVGDHDILVLHDPELLTVLPRLRRPPTVWDVHEDLAASLGDKAWLPSVAARPLRAVVGWAERLAERRLHLLLAEEGYAGRFRRTHPVVPNEPVVPESVAPPGDSRVVYLGRVSRGRGVDEMLALADRLPTGVDLELLGWADAEVEADLRAAAERGSVHWAGRVSNDTALDRVEGSMAGLSLLHDLPNYRHSRPTKVVEYMGRGVPVITTPNPVAVEIVERHRCGYIVPFGDVDAVADVLAELHADPELRTRLGQAGHAAACQHFSWSVSGPRFVRRLEAWAAR
jgi:glycosyltransferase involved in cell wall biosynthesis